MLANNKKFSLFLVCIFISSFINAQQATGQFIQMDGGFEGQPYASFSNQITNNKPTSLWSRYTLSKCSNIHGVFKAGSRSGNYYMGLNDTVLTNITNYAISPALASGSIVGGKKYFLQFYYRAKDTITLPNTQLSVGLSNASGTTATLTNFIPNSSPNNAVWLKSVTPVTAASGATAGNGFVVFAIASGANNNKKSISIDDVVLYADTTVDTIPPAIPGAVSVYAPTASTLTVKWGASQDVDGGGYLVVRYKTDPTISNTKDPNPNGIYSAGNTIDSGTVVYAGTATSFTSMLLDSNTTYYYRVYAVDKAFNYSASSVGMGSTNNGAVIPTYYIDSISGNDMNDGHSPTTAWQSIAKVNTTNFSPGDSILFKCGCTWSGTQLHPLGSGIIGKPIVVSKYGTGNLPIINGNTATQHNENAVYLYNQEYFTISDLEITNNYKATALPKDTAIKKGVYVLATNFGIVNNITLKNLYVHDVLGTYDKDVNSGGIFCNIQGTGTPTAFDSLLIDNCKVKNVDLTGISNQSSWTPLRSLTNDSGFYPSTHFIIQNCEVDSIGGNSIVARAAKAPIIQYNKVYKSSYRYTGNSIFVFNCDDALIQHNESSFNKFNSGDHDAAGFDGDYRCHRTVFQYNYSHDNDGGAFVVVCDPNYANSFNDSCIIRYNISQNDSHTAGGSESAIFRIDGNVSNVTCYNNSIYTSKDIVNAVFHCAWGGGTTGSSSKFPKNTSYYNNIFYLNKNSTGFKMNASTNNLFNYNTFYYPTPYSGTHPTDANALTTDPKFVAAGSASSGISSVNGYKLQSNSPCNNSGILLSNHSTFDYWSNPVPGTVALAPCRGAYEYASALPVKLIEFRGIVLNETNQLYWTSVEEINNSGFELQKSEDGKAFNDLSFIPTKTATGNSASKINYGFNDVNPLEGNNYYRLKQIDRDGRINYSSIVVIKNPKKHLQTITVFPNPIKEGNSFSLMLNNIPKGKYQLKIINISNKIVDEKSIEHNGINGSIIINSYKKLAKGTYIASIYSNDKMVNCKFLVN